MTGTALSNRLVDRIHADLVEIERAMAYLEGQRDALQQLLEPGDEAVSGSVENGKDASGSSTAQSRDTISWREALQHLPGGEFGSADLARIRGVGTRAQAGVAIGTFVKQGVVERIAPGRYRLPEAVSG